MDKCKDCIHERICKMWSDQECQNASCFCDDCFEPKRKPEVHAEWMEPSPYANGAICSQCETHSTRRSKYCPECGAKMDREEQNEKVRF